MMAVAKLVKQIAKLKVAGSSQEELE